jgi:hypothetical protein
MLVGLGCGALQRRPLQPLETPLSTASLFNAQSWATRALPADRALPRHLKKA